MRLIRRISICVLPLLFAAAACDEPTASNDPGVLTGQLNGAEWDGDAVVVIMNDTVGIFSSSRAADGTERHLAFFAVAEGPGEYSLLTDLSRYDETVGGDLITYSAAVTGGSVTFSSLGRGNLLASGTTSGVTLQGSRGAWTFTGGEFTGMVEVQR